VGYVIYRFFKNHVPGKFKRAGASLLLVLIFAIGFSLLPDFDSVAGILAGNFGRYHNNITHSLVAGVLVAFAFAIAAKMIIKSGFWFWFAIFALGYSLHILMDFLTFGERGIMLFWPLSLERFESPVKLFYGVRWSADLLSPVHLNTLVNEFVFVFLVGVILLIIERKRTATSNKKGLPNSLE
jgi:inner membrane protein